MPYADPEARRAYQRAYYQTKDQREKRSAWYQANKAEANDRRKRNRVALRQGELWRNLTALDDGH